VYRFEAALWRWEAQSGWFFVSLPEDVSDEIEARAAGHARGFGSVKVRVTVGTSTWSTSVFPDGKRKVYVLPVKRQVRDAEALDEGTAATFELEPVGLRR
jgi:hypothetical protein